jgi:flagellin-like hook-associated protein FlgL
MRINLTPSMNVQRQLGITSKAIARSLERLSSGKEVNSAKDDAARLSISTKIDAQTRGFLQANQNINQAQGLLQTAEGAIGSQVDIVIRMRELAVQAANGTLTAADRSNINQELSQLFSEFQRITNSTEFNGMKLLDGSLGQQKIQSGANNDNNIGSVRYEIADLSASRQFIKTVGTGNYKSIANTSIGSSTIVSGETGDFNNDGKLDYITVDPFFDRVSLLLGKGDGTFQTALTRSTGSGALQLAVGDFNNDGNLDFVTSDETDQTLSVFLGKGDGTFNNRVTLKSSAITGLEDLTYLQVADVNNDSKADIVVSDPGNSRLLTFLGNGDGSFDSSNNTSVSGLTGGQFVLSDMNRDGILDLVGQNGSTNVYIYFGNGAGSFTFSQTVAAGGSVLSVKVGDLNGDGAGDIVTAFNGSSTVLLNNGTGQFSTRTTYSVGSFPGDINLGDMNNDGFLDILTPNSSSNTVSILLGNGNGTFQTQRTYSGYSAPVALRVGDFTNDGVLDFLTLDSGTGGISFREQRTMSDSAVSDVDVSTQSKARSLLSILDTTLSSLKSEQAKFGGIHDRLDMAASTNLILSDTLSDAKSKMMDVDFALETAELVKHQILQQAQLAVFSQANLQMQIVLQLLK